MSYVQISKESFDFLNILRVKYPHYLSILDSIEEGLNLRLWNRISDDLIQISDKEDLKSSTDLIAVYNAIVYCLEKSFNPMKLMLIVQNVMKNYNQNMDQALIFLDDLESRLENTGEEKHFMKILKGNALLELNKLYECEEIIKGLKIQLEKSFEVDQLIYSNFYKLSALYYEKKENFDEFYNNALQYLAYVKEGVLFI